MIRSRRAKFPPRAEQRRQEAADRQAAWDSLTPLERIAKVTARAGADCREVTLLIVRQLPEESEAA